MGYLDENGLRYLWTKIKGYVDLKVVAVNRVYPIGSIYMSTNSTNPGTLFGGTWAAWGSGRVPVGIDASQSEFNAIEKTGGTKTHTLTAQEMPTHNHTESTHLASLEAKGYGLSPTYAFKDNVIVGGRAKASGVVTTAGGDGAHNNLQPYIVCYMWKRTE